MTSGVFGAWLQVEQCPVLIVLQEPVETLCEATSRVRVLTGAGEHSGPREDFAAGVALAVRASGTGTDTARGGIESGLLLRQFLL